MRELYREFAAHRLRVRDDYTRDVIQAWQAEWIRVKTQNDKRMPTLASMLPNQDAESRTVQSFEEQKAAIEMLSKLYGGKIVTLKRGA